MRSGAAISTSGAKHGRPVGSKERETLEGRARLFVESGVEAPYSRGSTAVASYVSTMYLLCVLLAPYSRQHGRGFLPVSTTYVLCVLFWQ